jgi:hypothetical protein
MQNNTCSKFQYAYTLDEEKRLDHIFWSPTCCYDWYEKYGDVVVFDTTYKVNSYEMPFGIFVGMNNHGKTVLFGCALLRNDVCILLVNEGNYFLHYCLFNFII